MDIISVGGSFLGKALASGEACPLNGKEGYLVLRARVANHVKEELWGRPAPVGRYRFCPDPDCPIAYYDNGSRTYVAVWELRSRVFHKERRRDRPVCHCAGVTEEDLLREAAHVQSLEELMEKTGAGQVVPHNKPKREMLPRVSGPGGEAPNQGRDRRGGHRKGGPGNGARGPPGNAWGWGQARVLRIGGMHCEGCAVAVRTALEEAGVKVFRVDFRRGKALVAPDADLEAARRAVDEAGYRFLGAE